ncbi:MAG: type I DNA topoisomerase [Alloprevotella sp.]|nr:type I DNA topoisomerase [Alloprevotella sp.]
MQKNLVIVESPAKAKTIERFLGSDFKVMSSFGHIRDLKKKNFGVDLKTFAPEYEVPEDKQRIVSELRAAAKKSERIWLASDEDREGEAISWHLAEVLGLDATAQNRIVFHEITKPAILAAIENPRTIDLNLVDAQQARRVLDRLVGFRLSPVLWRKVRPQLSAGRVQSVAVRLIVEREREIEAFTPEASWHVTGEFAVANAGDGQELMKAELHRTLSSAEEARALLERLVGASYRVSDIQCKPLHRSPAPPFTTSTLQQDAARRLGYPVATTMRVAQSLYERGLITYMRTDSLNLSKLFLATCGPVIKEDYGESYYKSRRFHTQAKGAQEAHEAIRPTDAARRTITGTRQEQRLYDLIWKRTMASQMADATLEKTVISVEAVGKGETFVATGEVVKFDGFLRLYTAATDNEMLSNEPTGLLPAVSKGQSLTDNSIQAQQRFTSGPFHFNEASLVHRLEELGIGRPSTYAPTISTIQQREYVRKADVEGSKRTFGVITLKDGKLKETTKTETFGSEKNKLMPTDIGIVVTDFLTAHFADILDYNFTARVEKDFDAVAEGKENWTEVIRSFYGHFEPQVAKTMEEKTDKRVGERILGNDPQTGKPVSVKIGRFGPMAQIGDNSDGEKPRFAKLQPSMSLERITLEEALELFKLPRTLGEADGKTVSVGVGRFGPYVRHDKTYASIPKDVDPLSISLDEALQLLAEKREKDAKKHIKKFEEKGIEVMNGRFGPYIAFDGNSYKLPKADAARAAELTEADCLRIIEEVGKKKKRK